MTKKKSEAPAEPQDKPTPGPDWHWETITDENGQWHTDLVKTDRPG